MPTNNSHLSEWRQKRYALVLQEIYQNLPKEVHNLEREVSLGKKALDRTITKLFSRLKIAQEDSKAIDYINLHEKILKHLRLALKKIETINSLDEKQRTILNEVCFSRFTQTQIFAFSYKLIEQVIFQSLKEKYPNDNQNQLQTKRESLSIEEEFKLIDKANPKLFKPSLYKLFMRKFWGRLNTNFDPHLYNHPFVLYDVELMQKNGQPKTVRVLRMGTPTKEVLVGLKAEVIIEFKGYLNSLKRKGLIHLYINKQQLTGFEKNRSNALMNLQEEYDNFIFVTIPSDGRFYELESPHMKDLTFTSFKKDFIDRMNHNNTFEGFYFPCDWVNNNEFIKSIEKIMNTVHQDFFLAKEKLTKDEFLNFIDHFYTLLELFIIQYSGCDYVNITCKDGIDRAAKEQTKLLLYLQVLFKHENDPNSFKQRLFCMHAPAFFVKKRAIIASRRKRLICALRSYTKEVKENLFIRNQREKNVLKCPVFQFKDDQKIGF